MDSKIKKYILEYLPYVLFGYFGNKASYAYRFAEGKNITNRLINTLNDFVNHYPQLKEKDYILKLQCNRLHTVSAPSAIV